MHYKITTTFAALLTALTASGAALAEGAVELKTSALQEVKVTDADGKEEVRLQPASKVVPGNEVIYMISARNRSQSAIGGVVIDDPIPDHMTYVLGSASEEDSDVTFSVDGGKTFAKPAQLTVSEEGGSARKAEAKDYTDIRWVLREPLRSSATRSVSFRARLD